MRLKSFDYNKDIATNRFCARTLENSAAGESLTPEIVSTNKSRPSHRRGNKSDGTFSNYTACSVLANGIEGACSAPSVNNHSNGV